MSSKSPSEEDLEAYAYDLPERLIAQRPPERRGDSRLLVLERRTGRREHRTFRDLPSYLRPGDLLVVNETRVFPARLRTRRETGGKVEVLLLECLEGGAWEALARPTRALVPGEELKLEAEEAAGAALRVLRREAEKVAVEVLEAGRLLGPPEALALCERAGETPLPPYLRRAPGQGRDPADRDRYQTVFARNPGAAAAPTAGLHFTEEILEEVRRAGATVAPVTLHVGLGTFKPLTPDALRAPTLHAEQVEVSPPAAAEILGARAAGRRTIAVGTTSVRAIESLIARGAPGRWRTDLFIKPGYPFRGTDALVTNFHLPRSSLLVLVSAFAGRELVLETYREAVREGYRFYSFGDAMLVL
ncbi:MAG: tRNA preQ1(34) S-adenosylmethionine ribosyltransferase-isomerase QueA [Planctomycetes bacterium]|nr:tRNA preQ1(34) S-adenosylmethionine ribosyltransferase-isomerase QueA [Planctomycetota bacterium]